MRGEVLHYDEAQGFGFITAADGNRYTFRREDLRRAAPMTKGTSVEFEPNAGQAKGVFSIRATPQGAAAGMSEAAAPQHFGRYAVHEAPAGTGLWSYFWRCVTVNYAGFRGRARRKEYWGYFLFWMIAFTIAISAAVGVDAAVGSFDGSTELPVVTIIVTIVFILATFLPGLAVTVRRIHDIGLSGWFYLLVFVPYVGALIVFVFSLIPSQAHDNKWGPVPVGVVVRPPAIPAAT